MVSSKCRRAVHFQPAVSGNFRYGLIMVIQTTSNSFKMKRLFISLTAIAIFLLFFVSCYYDNEEALYPTLNNACDTTSVTFSGTIVPILSSNCYSCHSNANAPFGGGIHLQTIADVVTNSAKMAISIKQTGAKPMPPSGKLSTCSIAEIDIWIRNGMPNN